MTKILAALSIVTFLLLSSVAFAADVYVHGYTRSDGTYVQPYYRSAPDSNPYNNYSTKGNVNPYTGQAGTKNPDSYGSGSSGYGYQQQNSHNNNYDPYGLNH